MAVGLSEIKFLNIGFIIFCLIFIKENVLPHLPNIDLRPVNKRAMLNQMDRRKKKSNITYLRLNIEYMLSRDC
jgi:hypothetical protein